MPMTAVTFQSLRIVQHFRCSCAACLCIAFVVAALKSSGLEAITTDANYRIVSPSEEYCLASSLQSLFGTNYLRGVRLTSKSASGVEKSTDKDIYVYFPAIRQVRHLSVPQRGDAFFGTDFTYGDLETPNLEDFVVKKKIEKNGRDRSCEEYFLERREDGAGPYSAIRMCIDESGSRTMWLEFMKEKVLMRRLDVQWVKPGDLVRDQYVVKSMKMRNLRQNTETSFEVESDVRILGSSDDLFSMRNLEFGDPLGDRRRALSD
jgi:Outer membrane lipoprotein-sorting protein